MTDVTLKLDPVALREATSQAIMGILTPEVRAEIISRAIQALLNPSTNSWDRSSSPLERAFNDATQQVAREVSQEVVRADPAIRDRIKALAEEAARHFLTADASKFTSIMSTAIAELYRKEGEERAHDVG